MRLQRAFSAERGVPVALWAGFFLLLAMMQLRGVDGDGRTMPLSCGSDDGANGGSCSTPAACTGCAADGACCLVSNNCLAGSICNQPSEDLYVADEPSGVCVRVVCNNDGDCEDGFTCGLAKICVAPSCQVNADCPTGVCLEGACQAAPAASLATTCEVLTTGAILRAGATLPLNALARDASGALMPTIEFEWSSANPSIVRISDQTAIGDAVRGETTLTAMVKGTETVCEGTVAVTNLPGVPAGTVRVTVVDEALGLPVADAAVVLVADSTRTATTGAEGVVEFQLPAATPFTSVSIMKSGWQSMTILDPSTRDLYVPYAREVDKTKVGGLRGVLDLSKTKSADLKLGIAGPALPSNLLALSLDSFLGDSFPTQISFAGIDQSVDLPGGVLLGFESQQFSADTARCQGVVPGTGELGCFVARAPQGRTAAWAFGGQLRIRDVTPIVTKLAAALKSTSGEIDVAGFLTAILPLTQSMSHGVVGQVDVESHAVSTEGVPDYASFSRRDITVSHPLKVLSKVSVPNLPVLGGGDGACAEAMVVAAASILPGRGIVPLGLSAALDVLAEEVPDCRVAGVEKPFGDNSEALPDGVMPLAMAPPHGGLEGAPMALLALALDLDSLSNGGDIQLSALVSRVDAVRDVETVPGSFLGFPTGSIRKQEAAIALDRVVEGADATRVELESSDGRTWIVFAPAAKTRLELPAIKGSADFLSDLVDGTILSVKLEDSSYAALWTLGSGKTIDRLIDEARGFSVQFCAESTEERPDPGCQIE
ncbi:MAG: hypothetical protein IPK13_18340 [Deltaproteobacteria bacterium]|nr:hypothetical protein [Deltaproteobacteria bacterium]